LKEAAVRVLLVYGYKPSGHAAAAFALEEALRAEGLLVSSLEVAGDHHPAAGRAVARGYYALLKAAPAVWGALYRSKAARAALSGVRRSYFALGGARGLAEGVARRAPDLIVCPQASVAAVFAQARRAGILRVPVVSVMTDYGAHPFWADPAADLVLAPTERAAAELRAFGAPAVIVTGVPIHPVFADLPPRESARRFLALPSSAPVVLVSGGSKGLGEIDACAEAILKECPRARVLALCGADDRLRRTLAARRESGERLRVFGPQPPGMVCALLAASDLHVGKPGGLTAAESLAAGVPMILIRPLPGQEEANALHLLSRGAAIAASSPEAAGRVAAALLNDRARLAGLRAAAANAGRADSARRAALAIARFAGSRERVSF
jgi:processive 1,2-diacylglycerol beta-glucosyltransferase